jgi:hypothetical protein
MCGRYRGSRRKEMIEECFSSVSGEDDWSPRYNIAPTQPVPVIRQHPKEPVRHLSLMKWGLIPSWAKDRSVAARRRYRRCRIRSEHHGCVSGQGEWRVRIAGLLSEGIFHLRNRNRRFQTTTGFSIWASLGRSASELQLAFHLGVRNVPIRCACVCHPRPDPAVADSDNGENSVRLRVPFTVKLGDLLFPDRFLFGERPCFPSGKILGPVDPTEEIDQTADETGPTGLVTGSQPRAVVSVEVFVE